jgi:hypothetical protein
MGRRRGHVVRRDEASKAGRKKGAERNHVNSYDQLSLHLGDDLRAFIVCRDIRLLHIATGGAERSLVLGQVRRAEGLPYNKSPFFTLEDPHTRADLGWVTRAGSMMWAHEARRTAMARKGRALAALAGVGPLPLSGSLATVERLPLLTFAWATSQCLQAQAKAADLFGLVLVIAPAELEFPELLLASLGELASVDALETVRFVIIEVGDSAAAPARRLFGDAAVCVRRVSTPGEEPLASSAPLVAPPEPESAGPARAVEDDLVARSGSFLVRR